MKTPENLAKRYNSGKLQWSLVHYPSLEPMVKVLEYGAEKYSADNWKKGLHIRKAVESLLRHTYAFLDGEDLDSESGLPHIGHMQANTMFLAYMMANYPNLDDRCVEQPENEFLGNEGDLTNLTETAHNNYLQTMKDAGITVGCCTTTCSNDKLHVNLMGGHYVGNIESEESKSIIDSKV